MLRFYVYLNWLCNGWLFLLTVAAPLENSKVVSNSTSDESFISFSKTSHRIRNYRFNFNGNNMFTPNEQGFVNMSIFFDVFKKQKLYTTISFLKNKCSTSIERCIELDEQNSTTIGFNVEFLLDVKYGVTCI